MNNSREWVNPRQVTSIDGITVMRRLVPPPTQRRAQQHPTVLHSKKEYSEPIIPITDSESHVAHQTTLQKFFATKNFVTNCLILVFISVSEAIPFLLARPHFIAAGYIVMVLVLRISGYKTFRVALICLALTPVFTLIGHSAQAESYALLAFFFLIVGLLSNAIPSLSKE